jgi:hypothetical protein
VPADGERLTQLALGRALLARQGLLERLRTPLVEAVEAIGAPQAQHWPALPVALWSRVEGFAPEDLYRSLEREELVVGTLVRGTLHLVSAREHPIYAAAVAASGGDEWRRTAAPPSAEVAELRAQLLAHARAAPRSGEELAAFIEEWVQAHPGAIDPAELEHQRKYRWRAFLRWSSLVRAPANGHWGTKAPAALRAGPGQGERTPAGALRAGPGQRERTPAGKGQGNRTPAGKGQGSRTPSQSDPSPSDAQALAEAVRRHLRGFGPASAEDAASWLGWRVKPVRAALEQLAPELVRVQDEGGRTLYDLPDAPRPDPETPAPVRLLAPFDSVLLAYEAKRRARIVPDAHREAIYERANLRVLPTFLIDGLVAGTWSMEVRRREATVTLRPFARLSGAPRKALLEEARALARAVQPDAQAHRAVVEG